MASVKKDPGDLGNNTEEGGIKHYRIKLLPRAEFNRNFCKEVNQQYDGRI